MTARNARGTRTLPQIFAIPILLGILSAVGLVAALVGDGLWDAAGWAGLGIPVVVCFWYWLNAKPK